MILLETIGAFTVLVVGFYLLLQYFEGKKNTEKKIERLAIHNNKSKTILDKYIQDKDAGKPVVSHYEMQQQLAKILADPKEEKKAMDKIAAKEQEAEDRLQILKQNARAARKIAYKYEEEIFAIFDDNKELSKEVIIGELKQKLHLDSTQTEELFSLLLGNRIIDVCAWSEGSYMVYEVGHALVDSFYSIDDADMTHYKWLKLHNKVLKQPSEKAAAYQLKYGWNFSDD